MNSEIRKLTRSLPAALLLIGLLFVCASITVLAQSDNAQISGFVKDVMLGVMLFLIVTNPGPATPFIYFQF